MYQYGWLDKVTQITEGDKVIRSFRYHMDGQLAAAYDGSNTETFLWDGLALIRRDTTNYLNEPAVTGGNPVIAGEKTLFNDLLGSTLGAKSADGFSAIERDAFGEVKPGETADLGINFFTGKPQVEGLGYTFLFRNYRPDQGKWQTADPLGYPDGWNNLAYVNNGVTVNVDWLGAYKLANGYESAKEPGSYSWTGNSYSVGGFLYFFSGGYKIGDGGLCYAFAVPDSPGGWEEGFGYIVNEDGSVDIPSIYSGETFSGTLINNGMGEHEFSFSIDISVSYYVTTETTYNEDNSITIDYYGNVVYSLFADGVELCNSTVSPHKPILLNTVEE